MKRPLILAIALATLTANAAAHRGSNPSPCAVPNN